MTAPTATFDIVEPSLADVTTDLLGLWRVTPGEVGALSFDAASSADGEMTVWQVDLPARAEIASQLLSQKEQAIAGAASRLEAVDERLDLYVASRQGTAVSFATPATQLPPEADLTRLLDEMALDDKIMSFGIADRWNESAARFRRFLERTLRSMTNLAWVETSQGGGLVGRTIVGWTGDQRTCWLDNVSASQATLHRRSLSLSVASRTMTVRVAMRALAAAPRLALLMSGTGTIMALPAAWRFICGVMEEIDTYQKVKDTGNGIRA